MIGTVRADVVVMLCWCSQVKNVGSNLLEGKVGRIYMPRQEVDKLALAKPKGVKRARREAAAELKAAKAAKNSSSNEGGGRGGDAAEVQQSDV